MCENTHFRELGPPGGRCFLSARVLGAPEKAELAREVRAVSPRSAAQRTGWSRPGRRRENSASGAFPMEPLGKPPTPAEERPSENPESSPSPAGTVKEPGGAGQAPAGGKKPPPPRPTLLRVPPPSLGYGAFRRQVSASPEPPSPGPLGGELSRDGEASGAELRGRDADGWISPTEGLAASLAAPTCRCRCRELGLEKEDSSLLQRSEADAAAAKLPRAIKLIGLPAYLRSLQWALAIMAVLLAVSAVAIVVLASRTGASCQPCPKGWVWSEEHCYYLSAEAQAWEAGQAFCSAHQATLPLLSHTQAFLSRYPVTRYSWVGARRGSQGWHWTDGAPLPPQLFPEEDKDQPDLQCAGLQGGKLVAFDCASARPWVCVKGTE
ncbi:PREDICTED: killer cell lectin-like receptor subfamily G member 2 [Condylura cristata]|uniref:killer cell lectin-like receptor subfamily G member 2 n=1 Tax=Condylura cristata TaxID=143302 RepID=UPI000643C64C|nr:PREDICTED: killer cell lectin-like receptor subfamily G member 2 [Condylura cristata]